MVGIVGADYTKTIHCRDYSKIEVPGSTDCSSLAMDLQNLPHSRINSSLRGFFIVHCRGGYRTFFFKGA